MSSQVLKKISTELQFVGRNVFIKEVITQNFWSFELGTKQGISVPMWIIIVFQRRERQDSQNLANDTFYRPPVTNAQCPIGTENYPDSAILTNYDDDDYGQGYGLIKEAFKALTKDVTLQPYTSEHDFRSFNNDNNIGYNMYIFDIRYKKIFTDSQPIKVEIKISENVPAGIYGYALILTNKLV